MYLLITGASGHIGSSIAHLCNKKKIKTILLTRSEKKKNYLKKRFKNCLIETFKNFKKNKNKINYVVHAASINDKYSNKNKNAVDISLNITKKIFSNIDKSYLKKIIYLSTAQVYGSNLNFKVSENTLLEPINNYGLSRQANELYLETLSKKFNLNLIILRLSNVVGDPIIFDKNCLRLLPNDIKNQANKSGIIQLKSSGKQSRNFISLYSTSRLIIELIKIKVNGIQKLNLGGVNTSVISFVKKFILLYSKKNKRKIKLIIKSAEPKKVKKLFYQDSKIRKLLKIRRRDNLEFIVKNFIN
jgi:UDP-glucose 4-epimerase|tara:strand:- start:3414 stop:4316 length:903 start_codon:yes stop_codon:yes gene_type:complete